MLTADQYLETLPNEVDFQTLLTAMAIYPEINFIPERFNSYVVSNFLELKGLNPLIKTNFFNLLKPELAMLVHRLNNSLDLSSILQENKNLLKMSYFNKETLNTINALLYSDKLIGLPNSTSSLIDSKVFHLPLNVAIPIEIHDLLNAWFNISTIVDISYDIYDLFNDKQRSNLLYEFFKTKDFLLALKEKIPFFDNDLHQQLNHYKGTWNDVDRFFVKIYTPKMRKQYGIDDNFKDQGNDYINTYYWYLAVLAMHDEISWKTVINFSQDDDNEFINTNEWINRGLFNAFIKDPSLYDYIETIENYSNNLLIINTLFNENYIKVLKPHKSKKYFDAFFNLEDYKLLAGKEYAQLFGSITELEECYKKILSEKLMIPLEVINGLFSMLDITLVAPDLNNDKSITFVRFFQYHHQDYLEEFQNKLSSGLATYYKQQAIPDINYNLQLEF